MTARKTAIDKELEGRALRQFERFESVDRVLKRRDGVLRLAVKEARPELSQSAMDALERTLFFS